MKEYDRVQLVTDKPKYAKYGVRKGMEGWICDPRVIDNKRLVCFDEWELSISPTIDVNETDLIVVKSAVVRDVGVNVILLTDKYVSDGFYKGMKGVICDRGNQDGEWVVKFAGQSVRLTVDENDIIINYE